MNSIFSLPTLAESLRFRRPSRLAPMGFPSVAPAMTESRLSPLAYDTFQGASGVDLDTRRTQGQAYPWVKHVNNASVGDVVLTGAGAARKGATGVFGVYTLPTLALADCSVSGRIRLTASPGTGSPWVGVCARYRQDENSGYAFYYQHGSGLILQQFVAGTGTTLGSYNPARPTNSDDKFLRNSSERDIRLECVGSKISGYLDGVLIISATDSTWASGSPGVFALFATDDTTGCHLAGWSVQTGIGVWPDAGGTTYYRGGVTAIRSNGARIDAGYSGEAAYQWFRSTSRDAAPTTATALPGQVYGTLDDRSARPGQTYYYRVGVAAAGGSEVSADWLVTTPALTAKRVVCEGNSLTWGVGTGVTIGADDYPAQLLALLGSPWETFNLGVPSVGTPQLTEFAPRRTDPWRDMDLAKCILVHWEVTNDLLSNSGAAAWANTVTHLEARRKAGWNAIVVCNAIDRQQTGVPGDMATRISDYNALAAANWSSYADGFADLYANTELQDSTNATYFDADKVHLVAAGFAVVASTVQTVVSGL